MVISWHDKLADGNLYTWGRGFGCASDTCTPCLFDAALSFNDVALGWDHALLLTSTKTFSIIIRLYSPHNHN